MPVEINTDQSEVHVVQSVPLDGQDYQFEFIWRRRPQLWYMSVRMPDGQSIVEGEAIQPGSVPLNAHTIDQGPPGELVVIGPDDYDKDQLSNELRLVYFTEDELGESTTQRDFFVYK